MTNSRPECLTGRSCQPQSFAEAVDCVAHHSEIRLAQVAERVGRDANYLRKACSQFDAEHPFRGDLIVPLTVATRNFAMVEYIARAVGGAFFELPSRHDDGHTVEALARRAIREVFNVSDDLHKAPPAALTHQIDDAIQVLAALKAALALSTTR